MNEPGNSRPAPPHDCPLERYLHVVSGAWVPRILWFLRFGARRFGDLRRDLKSISPKVLTDKLRALEAEGLVVRRVIDASPPQVEYSLSARGRAFDPVFDAMTEVSAELERLDAVKAAEFAVVTSRQ
jgi:DNA-binding HxlR family transcriptional regulator